MKMLIEISKKVYDEYMNLATGPIPKYKACDIANVLKNGILINTSQAERISKIINRDNKGITDREALDILHNVMNYGLNADCNLRDLALVLSRAYDVFIEQYAESRDDRK